MCACVCGLKKFKKKCQELQKKTSSQTESSNFFLEKSQVQCQLASVSDRKQLKKQLVTKELKGREVVDTVVGESNQTYKKEKEN